MTDIVVIQFYVSSSNREHLSPFSEWSSGDVIVPRFYHYTLENSLLRERMLRNFKEIFHFFDSFIFMNTVMKWTT